MPARRVSATARREIEAEERRDRPLSAPVPPAPAALLLLQRAAGNQAVAGLLASAGAAPALGIQRVTYAVKTDNESAESFAEVQDDANRAGDPPVVTNAAQFKQVDFKAQGDAGRTLNVFAHGNQAAVAGKSPSALAQHLVEECEMPKRVRKIILHSCMSAVPDPRRDKPTFGKTYAAQLHAALVGRLRHAEVTGQKGFAFTDLQGVTRVLKPGIEEADYKRRRNAARTPQEQRAIEDESLVASSETYGSLREAVTQEDLDAAGQDVDVAVEVIRADPGEYLDRSKRIESNLRWRAEQTEDEYDEEAERKNEPPGSAFT